MRQKPLAFISKFTWLDWMLIGIFFVSCIYLIFFGWSRLNQRVVPVEYLAKSEIQNEIAILVDIGGAVVAPGVYKLSGDARVKDALVAAGGVTDAADRDFLEKNLNQAERLKDGEKIYIPEVDGVGAIGKVRGERTQLININTASEAELDSLPQIGKGRAGAIVSNRPYKSVEELLSKGVLSNYVYEQVKSRVSVY